MLRVPGLLVVLLLPAILAACQNAGGPAPCDPPSFRDATGECVSGRPRR